MNYAEKRRAMRDLLDEYGLQAMLLAVAGVIREKGHEISGDTIGNRQSAAAYGAAQRVHTLADVFGPDLLGRIGTTPTESVPGGDRSCPCPTCGHLPHRIRSVPIHDPANADRDPD